MTSFLADAALFLPTLLRGLAVTVGLTLAALAFSLLVGPLLALAGMGPFAPLRWAAGGVITVVRGIPIIVQLFCIYFVLPEIGIDLPPSPRGWWGWASPLRSTRRRISAPASSRSIRSWWRRPPRWG